MALTPLQNRDRGALRRAFANPSPQAAVPSGPQRSPARCDAKQTNTSHGAQPAAVAEQAHRIERGIIAHSLHDIYAELDIHLLYAGAGDAEAKGVIKRWHRTWREEAEDELGDAPLPLADLAAKHWAWLGSEYHARKHETTGRVAHDHLLADAHEIRAVPLDEIFLIAIVVQRQRFLAILIARAPARNPS
ncbi:MAG TPA: hypothetical protein VHN14_12475 [Kofleriaceae bacterium]|nr:hypothetical protein [Kofleriaceae bacterium]